MHKSGGVSGSSDKRDEPAPNEFHSLCVEQPWAWLLCNGFQILHNSDYPLHSQLLDHWFAVVASPTFDSTCKEYCLHPLILHYLRSVEPRIFVIPGGELSEAASLQFRSDVGSRTYIPRAICERVLQFFKSKRGNIVGCVRFQRGHVASAEQACRADPEFVDTPSATNTHWLVGHAVSAYRKRTTQMKSLQITDAAALSSGALKLLKPAKSSDMSVPPGVVLVEPALIEALTELVDSALSDGSMTVVTSGKVSDEYRMELRQNYWESYLKERCEERAERKQALKGAAGRKRKRSDLAQGGSSSSLSKRRKKQAAMVGDAIGDALYGSDASSDEEETSAHATEDDAQMHREMAVASSSLASAAASMSRVDSEKAQEFLKSVLLESRAGLRRLTAERRRKKGDILANLTPSQRRRMECFSRSTLNRTSVKVAMQRSLDQASPARISDESAIVMQALCKSVVMELCEHARLAQLRADCTTGPIRPSDLREALRELNRDSSSFLSKLDKC